MYFPNGTSGLMFQEQHCFRCLHLKDLEDGRGPSCPIWDAHTLYNYEQLKDDRLRSIFDLLIPEESATCSMFMNDEKDHDTIDMFGT